MQKQGKSHEQGAKNLFLGESKWSFSRGVFEVKMHLFQEGTKKIPDPKAEDCLFCLSNTNYHELDTNFQK